MIAPTLENSGFTAVVYSHMPQLNGRTHTETLTTVYAVKDGKRHKVSELHKPQDATAAKKRLHKQLCLSK